MAIIIDSEEDQMQGMGYRQEQTCPPQQGSMNATDIQVEYLYATGIFRANGTEFLKAVTPVHKEAIDVVKREHPEILKSPRSEEHTSELQSH